MVPGLTFPYGHRKLSRNTAHCKGPGGNGKEPPDTERAPTSSAGSACVGPRVLGFFPTFFSSRPPQLHVSFSEQGMSPPPTGWDIPGVAPSLYPFPLKAVFPQVTSLLRATSFCAQHPEHTGQVPGHGWDFRTGPCAGGYKVVYRSALESHRTLDCHRSYRRAEGTSQRSQTLVHPSPNNYLPGMGALKRRRNRCHQGREKADLCNTHNWK